MAFERMDSEEQICKRAMEYLRHVPGVVHAWIVKYDPRIDRLVRLAGIGYYGDDCPGGPLRNSCHSAEGVTGLAYQTKQVQVVHNYHLWAGRFQDMPRTVGYAIACPVVGAVNEQDREDCYVLACCGESPCLPAEIEAHIVHYAYILRLALRNLKLRRELEREYVVSKQVAMTASRMEAAASFAGGFVHDIRNALQAILGHVDLIDGKIQQFPFFETEKVQNQIGVHLATIRNAIELSTAMCSNLLQFMRAPGQEAMGRRVMFEAGVTIPRILHLLRPLIECKGNFELSENYTPHALLPLTETELLEILTNLVVNAQEAKRPGERLRIRMRVYECRHSAKMLRQYVQHDYTRIVLDQLKDDQKALVIEIEDNGIGISPAIADRIFDPLFTTKTYGTGLGLATLYRIMSQIGGTLAFATGSQGTQFRLCLPMVAGEGLLSEPGNGSRKKPTVSECAPVPLRILLVEDDDMQRELLMEAMTSLGHRVAAYGDPLKVLQGDIPFCGKWDVVITDLVMPNMDGMTLLKHLADRYRGESFGRIVMSGYVDSSLVLETAKHDVIILTKPFQLGELMDSMAICLQQRRLQVLPVEPPPLSPRGTGMPAGR